MKTAAWRVGAFVAMTGLAAGSCGDAPTTPTDPGAPQISCPAAPPAAPATGSTGTVVNFGGATATSGTPPLTGPTCTPGTGSTFPTGTTTVTCTVSDSRGRTASCAFPVVVQSPPRLSLTRFLAFGDSMTAGEIVSEGLVTQGSVRIHPLLVDPFLSYPADLTRDLTLRYAAQQPFVTNAGVPGEDTVHGLVRLPSALSPTSQQPPQVLLLMEGVNDISGGDAATIATAVANLESMVRTAKTRSVGVVLGTLPPENASACTGPNVPAGCIVRSSGAALVVPFNAALKSMAAIEAVPVADVYQAFNGDVTTLIDFDGLHPTAAGYQVIANAFFATIRQQFEVSASTTISVSGASMPMRAPRPGRR